jgi:hypothetical protein
MLNLFFDLASSVVFVAVVAAVVLFAELQLLLAGTTRPAPAPGARARRPGLCR